LPCMEALQ